MHPRARPIPIERIPDLLAQYAAGKSAAQLSRETGFTVARLDAIIKDAGITRNERERQLASHPIKESVFDALAARYLAGEGRWPLAHEAGIASERLREALEKRGIEIRDQKTSAGTTARQQRLANTRSIHGAHIGQFEPETLAIIQGCGFAAIPQYAIHTWNVDIGIPSCHVIVELERNARGLNRDKARTEYLLNAGWSILVIRWWRSRGEVVFNPVVIREEILSFVDLVTRRDEPRGIARAVWGDRSLDKSITY